jgi:flagellar hook assembly protein FlgD
VHDVAGRRVRVLEDSFREAGRHAAVWDGRDGTGRRVAAGVYFVRLQAAGGELTRKIVLLR